jgi:hypothetical protein
MINKTIILFFKYLLAFILILGILYLIEKPAPAFYMGASVRFNTTLFFLIGPFLFLGAFIAHASLLAFRNKDFQKNNLNNPEVITGKKYATLIPFLIIISFIAFALSKIFFFVITLLIFLISLHSLAKINLKNLYVIFPFLGIFYFLFYFIYILASRFQ